jgi:carboxypeptidase family protein
MWHIHRPVPGLALGLLLALVVALGLCSPAIAQETTTGSLSGAVTDSTGGALPGATVTLTSEQGVKTFVTDGEGRFFAPYLTPGRYAVRVELSGFTAREHKGVEDPLDYVAKDGRSRMPQHGQITLDQMADLVAFLQSRYEYAPPIEGVAY